MTATITREVHNGKTYLETTQRGIRYTLRRDQFGWLVSTQRLALGRSNIGGTVRLQTLDEVAAKYRAFAGVDLLQAL